MAFWDRQDEKDECATDPTDPEFHTREPWRCPVCKTLMMNVNKALQQVPGAPRPRYGNPDYPNVCSMCFDILAVIDGRMTFSDIKDTSSYWKAAHEVWKSRQNQIKKMKPGENYL